MFKIKGVEYPVSLLKVYLHDNTFKQLDLLQEVYKCNSWKETLSALINACYWDIIDKAKKKEEELKAANQANGSVPQESENKDDK